MEEWYRIEKEAVLDKLQTSKDQGLSNEEAARRLEQYGQ